MDSSIDEELFLERLETLYEKELSDVRAFAQREHRPYDEVRPQAARTDSLPFELTTSKVRNRLAELHCKDLFDFHRDGDEKSPGKEQSEGHHDGTEAHSYDRLTLLLTVSILQSISQALESLLTIGGLQSFFLVVNPSDANDEGFLGGSMLGREFWRGHRGCGAAGARAFRTYCQKSQSATAIHAHETHSLNLTNYTYPSHGNTGTSAPPPVRSVATSTTSNKSSPAVALKTEVYAAMRNAVR